MNISDILIKRPAVGIIFNAETR